MYATPTTAMNVGQWWTGSDTCAARTARPVTSGKAGRTATSTILRFQGLRHWASATTRPSALAGAGPHRTATRTNTGIEPVTYIPDGVRISNRSAIRANTSSRASVPAGAQSPGRETATAVTAVAMARSAQKCAGRRVRISGMNRPHPAGLERRPAPHDAIRGRRPPLVHEGLKVPARGADLSARHHHF